MSTFRISQTLFLLLLALVVVACSPSDSPEAATRAFYQAQALAGLEQIEILEAQVNEEKQQAQLTVRLTFADGSERRQTMPLNREQGRWAVEPDGFYAEEAALAYYRAALEGGFDAASGLISATRGPNGIADDKVESTMRGVVADIQRLVAANEGLSHMGVSTTRIYQGGTARLDVVLTYSNGRRGYLSTRMYLEDGQWKVDPIAGLF